MGEVLFFFQNDVTKSDNNQVALWYVSIIVLHPAKSTQKERNTHTSPLGAPGFSSPVWAFWDTLHPDEEPMNAALCVPAHTVYPEYHC